MAIAYNATSQGAAVATSLTIAHTNTTANNVVMVLGMFNNFPTDFDPTCTYNGTNATQANEQINSSNQQHGYIFVLDGATADGSAHNIVWTPNASANMNASHTSYSEASAPSNVPDNNGASSENTTSHTDSLVTVANNCWVVGYGFAAGDPPVPSTGVTQRGTDQGNSNIGDSNGAVTPAGSYSMTWTRSPTLPISIHMVSIAPVGAAPNANFLTFFGPQPQV